jgi:cold shock CspA family protein
MAERGCVKKVLWDEERGGYFGFIERRAGDDVWFASVAVKGMSPAPGDSVEFVLADSERPRAKEIWRV